MRNSKVDWHAGGRRLERLLAQHASELDFVLFSRCEMEGERALQLGNT